MIQLLAATVYCYNDAKTLCRIQKRATVSYYATQSPPYLGGHGALPSPHLTFWGHVSLLSPAGFTPLPRGGGEARIADGATAELPPHRESTPLPSYIKYNSNSNSSHPIPPLLLPSLSTIPTVPPPLLPLFSFLLARAFPSSQLGTRVAAAEILKRETTYNVSAQSSFIANAK